MGKPNPRGNYICKIGYIDIYQKIDISVRGTGRDRKYEKKNSVGIYHAKYRLIGNKYKKYYQRYGVEDAEKLNDIKTAQKIAEAMVADRVMKPSIKRKNQ